MTKATSSKINLCDTCFNMGRKCNSWSHKYGEIDENGFRNVIECNSYVYNEYLLDDYNDTFYDDVDKIISRYI